jgi:hypothetical protein
MALIHKATLTPTKLELLTAWLPGRPWSGGVTESGEGTGSGGVTVVRSVGAYRFDDPAGEVGIESVLVRADGPDGSDGSDGPDGSDGSRRAGSPVLHVPLTYRAQPLAGAEEYLIGTTEHSVLGTRWVYDGCADPVWAAALATTVLAGGTQVDELVDAGDGSAPVSRPPTATVVGSGTPADSVADLVAGITAVTAHDGDAATVVRAGGLELLVVRVVAEGDLGAQPVVGETLTGQWSEGGPAVLASVRVL